MKIFSYLILLVITVNSYGQGLRDSIHVKTNAYEVIYSEKLEQPRMVRYFVKCTSGEVSRSGMNFYVNDSIKTSDNLDYKDNVYDKGHMAPAADFSCDLEMMELSFSYLNCALQNQFLNRGVWKSLETQERLMAAKDSVIVTIETVFSDSSLVLSTGATVPDGFYKKIWLKKKGEIYVYYFPNTRPTSKDPLRYLVRKEKYKENPKKVGYISNK